MFPYVPLQLLYFPYKYCIFVGRYTGLYNKSGHFLRIRQGGDLQKGTILCRVWRNDRWFVGNKNFGVVSHLIVGGGGSGGILPQKISVFFYPYDCNSLHFLKQIFGYTALHYIPQRKEPGNEVDVKRKLPITVKPEQNCKNLKFFQKTRVCGNCSGLKSEPGQW